MIATLRLQILWGVLFIINAISMIAGDAPEWYILPTFLITGVIFMYHSLKTIPSKE